MTGTLNDSKPDLMRRALDDLARHIRDSGLTTRQKLALACRALFDAGHDSGLAGQISARAERLGTSYTQRLGLGFDEITAGNLLIVDEDLNVLEGWRDGRPGQSVPLRDLPGPGRGDLRRAGAAAALHRGRWAADDGQGRTGPAGCRRRRSAGTAAAARRRRPGRAAGILAAL